MLQQKPINPFIKPMKYLGGTVGWGFLTALGFSLNGMSCAFPAALVTILFAIVTFLSFRRVIRGGGRLPITYF